VSAAPGNAAAVLSIGDELIAGDAVDTNAAWISARLGALGLRVVERRTAPDDEPAIERALKELAGRAPVVVATGGLGPTPDDLTRRALADAMGEALVEDAHAAARLRDWFADQGRELGEINLVQAMRPESAESLSNEHGTAPGLAARLGGAEVFVLPGPPREMRPMFETHIAPRLASDRPAWASVALHCFGLGESDVARRLGELLARDREPLVGTTASGGVVTVRIRAHEGMRSEIEKAARSVREALGAAVFAEGDQTLAGAVVGEMRRREATLTVAESCTGGLLGQLITDVPGSSAVFTGGWICYSNRFKRDRLGVDASALGTYGAVSAEVARAMAAGALARSGSDHALSITGIAGPEGGSREKPVGTVWIGRASAGGEREERLFRFPGGREDVRQRAAMSALGLLRLALEARSSETLLWEREHHGSGLTPG